MTSLRLLLWLALWASAEQPLDVRRGDLTIRVRVTGTVVVTDTIRLKSAIEGRVEDILASTYAWKLAGEPLGHLANKEMAAILDSRTTTERGVVVERWREVYAPTPIRCPSDCFLLRTFVKPKEWIKPKAVLFEACRLRLVGRVRPEDAQWVKDGQRLEFWAVEDPSRRLETRVANYVLDFQGEKVDPGGTFTMEMGPVQYLDPGTEWEGLMVPVVKKNVLLAPTEALINYAGAVYLPVRVSTGITTEALTEVTAGVSAKTQILVIDDARLKSALRHRLETDPGAVNRRIQEEYLKAAPKPRRTPSLPDIDAVPDRGRDYGDDPYAE